MQNVHHLQPHEMVLRVVVTLIVFAFMITGGPINKHFMKNLRWSHWSTTGSLSRHQALTEVNPWLTPGVVPNFEASTIGVVPLDLTDMPGVYQRLLRLQSEDHI